MAIDKYKQFPSQFGAEVLAGTSTEDAIAFGFRATYIRLANLGSTAEVYFNLASTEPASTGDLTLPIGGTVELDHVPQCSGMGFATASTGDTDVLKRISVIALG